MQVRQGTAPHLYEVESGSQPDKWYQVFANGTVMKCSCKGYLTQKTCKHLDTLQQYLRQTEGGVEAEETGISPPGTRNLSRWIKKIHGRDFIEYQGLLALAHEQGLIELGAEFISVTPELALAAAHAYFKDGRKFWDAGDATPQNVHSHVKAHFPRVALTRAKARCLRDALNIGLVAVEEVED
jgi:hypothetical protein